MNFGKILMIGGGITAGIALAPIVLGFGTGGVVAGSVATAIQSTIGNVAAGSLFAACQSAAASGLCSIGAFFGIGTTVVGGVIEAKTQPK